MKEVMTIQEKFKEIFYKQDPDWNSHRRFREAVKEFENETGLQAPYSGYDSMRSVQYRKSCK